MNGMKDFFESERKRFFEPDAYFTQRVMARLNDRQTAAGFQDHGFWDIVPSSTRPVIALALVLILCFVAGEVLLPKRFHVSRIHGVLAI